MLRIAQACGLLILAFVLWSAWNYTSNAQNVLWAFRPPRYTFWTGYGRSSAPQIHGNTIYYSGGYQWENQVYLYAIEKNSGKCFWKSKFPVDNWVYVNDMIIATSMETNHRQCDKTKEHWKIVAIDPSSGKILWEHQIPMVFDDLRWLGSKTNLFFTFGISRDESLVCALDPNSGKEIWRRTFPRMMEREKRTKFFDCKLNDDIISIKTPDGNILTIDSTTGNNTLKKSASDRFSTYDQTFSFNGASYFTDIDQKGYLTANCESKKESLFSLQTGIPTCPFTIVGNLLVFGTVIPNRQVKQKECYITAIDLENKNVRWKFKTRAPVDSMPLIVDGIIYVGLNFPDPRFYALDLLTGKKRWQIDCGPLMGANVEPILNNGVLYINGWKKVSAVECKTGKILWTFEPDSNNPCGSPVLDNGILYVSAEDGNLYALKISQN